MPGAAVWLPLRSGSGRIFTSAPPSALSSKTHTGNVPRTRPCAHIRCRESCIRGLQLLAANSHHAPVTRPRPVLVAANYNLHQQTPASPEHIPRARLHSTLWILPTTLRNVAFKACGRLTRRASGRYAPNPSHERSESFSIPPQCSPDSFAAPFPSLQRKRNSARTISASSESHAHHSHRSTESARGRCLASVRRHQARNR
ncbi:hypothetical protein C8R43DRAFT_1015467 [Mycena crocata]|nr:hypothetical protein C8R43DRAFT_1015467 [Mycena crocata]